MESDAHIHHPTLAERRLISESGFFDAAWYRETYDDVPSDADPLDHYMNRGAVKGYAPGPTFDPHDYLARYPDVPAGMNPLVHYLYVGAPGGRSYRSLQRRWQRRLIGESGLFDPDWYLRTYRDIAEAGVDPLDHYLDYGGAEGRSPSPAFCPQDYLARHPELPRGINPLLDYLDSGSAEEIRHTRARRPREYEMIRESGLFDPDWYLQTYRDIAEAGVDPLAHYLDCGTAEGRSPGPLFDARDYLARYPEIGELGYPPLLHYINSGAEEGRYAYGINNRSPAEVSCETQLLQLVLRPRNWPSIAVVLQVGAAGFSNICGSLSNIPCDYSLFVLTYSSSDETEIRLKLRQAGYDAQIVIRQCQEPAFGFAALLGEYADFVIRHDVVLHIIVPAEPADEAGTDASARGVIRTLLGSRYLVGSILSLFENERRMGLFYPETDEILRQWSQHWWSSGSLAKRILGEAGITYDPNAAPPPYPVGSCFWARVDAIRPLVSRQWSYNRLTGTTVDAAAVACALQRCMVETARQGGYNFTELAYRSGFLRINWTDWPKPLRRASSPN